jgi:predicted nucleic acid-binding Zn ribbon protein
MIYRWKCLHCGHITEVERALVDINRAPTEDEEGRVHYTNCDYPKWMRIISKACFELKGTGWAKDGYSKGENNE